ncbi:MAG: hypothetical protein ACUVTU_07260 [Desulfurispora sp.]|uniref:hypothetical protein n=1 Tax=Desulfurispora sp. TaxID=3014275 RepID=UPI004049AA7C
MTEQDREKLRTAIQEAAPGGRLSCAAARRLAEQFQVPPRQVGELCDEMKIKIYACELGCF